MCGLIAGHSKFAASVFARCAAIVRRPMTTPAVCISHLSQDLSRRHRRGGRPFDDHRARRFLRLSGAERRRQVDDHPLHHRHRQADLRQDRDLRHRCGEGLSRGAAADRALARRNSTSIPSPMSRRSSTGWAAISACARPERKARTEMLIERFDLRAACEEAVPRTLRRPQAPRHSRPRAGARSQAADPGRTDRGRGCRAAPRSVALSAGAQSRRQDHPAHLALSGRGGAAVPHHRHHQWRQDRARRAPRRNSSPAGDLEAAYLEATGAEPDHIAASGA